MKRLSYLLWLLTIGFCAPPCHAQEPDSNATMTLHVSTQLVLLDASVVNKQTGQPVGNLTLDDFTLSEDGQPQKLSYLSEDRLPLSLVFLFDVTETVQPVLKPLSAGAKQVLEHLRPEDEVAVMAFSSHTKLLQDFTTDHSLIEQAIVNAAHVTKMNDPTFIYNDVRQATQQSLHSTLPNSRRVQVWLTDGTANLERWNNGKTTGSTTAATNPKAELADELLHANVVVSALIERSVATDAFAPFLVTHIAGRFGDIAHFAELTGGPVLHTGRSEVAARFTALLDTIRQRYTLGYKPSVHRPQGTLCHIHVALSPSFAGNHPEVSVKNVIVRARSIYFR